MPIPPAEAIAIGSARTATREEEAETVIANATAELLSAARGNGIAIGAQAGPAGTTTMEETVAAIEAIAAI